jgi:hypothetical protein
MVNHNLITAPGRWRSRDPNTLFTELQLRQQRMSRSVNGYSVNEDYVVTTAQCPADRGMHLFSAWRTKRKDEMRQGVSNPGHLIEKEKAALMYAAPDTRSNRERLLDIMAAVALTCSENTYVGELREPFNVQQVDQLLNVDGARAFVFAAPAHSSEKLVAVSAVAERAITSFKVTECASLENGRSLPPAELVAWDAAASDSSISLKFRGELEGETMQRVAGILAAAVCIGRVPAPPLGEEVL